LFIRRALSEAIEAHAEAADHLDDLVDGIVAGRADLVAIAD
jgi:hypothetical protein